MKDKRGHRRHYIIAEANIKLFRDGSKWINTMLVNISKDGIGIYSKRPFKTREKIVVQIAFLEHKRLQIVEEINGTIRWARQIGNNYAAGIMFDKIINKNNYPGLWMCIKYAKSNK
ncbi:MAG: PilZ domain-containing protein [Deltaproteobacteria bacterium]|nr:PilZ domain-containing protein [Deltaproteobacteria bacterium]MBI3754947.1 PilZ domain-containing protein [Deltaproteobacteria bacterium]